MNHDNRLNFFLTTIYEPISNNRAWKTRIMGQKLVDYITETLNVLMHIRKLTNMEELPH